MVLMSEVPLQALLSKHWVRFRRLVFGDMVRVLALRVRRGLGLRAYGLGIRFVGSGFIRA